MYLGLYYELIVCLPEIIVRNKNISRKIVFYIRYIAPAKKYMVKLHRIILKRKIISLKKYSMEDQTSEGGETSYQVTRVFIRPSEVQPNTNANNESITQGKILEILHRKGRDSH